MTTSTLHGLFGAPPARLVGLPEPEAACQFSPLVPGAAALEQLPPTSLAAMTMLAAPGTIERAFDLATMLAALSPAAPFTVVAPKDMGGARLGRELAAFGCPAEESAKAHHRICRGLRPATLDEGAIEAAKAAGALRWHEALGLWTQPGIFAWDRVDPGTALLREALPPLAGRGADFGCGIGHLAHAVLEAPAVTHLDLIDIDRRAVEAARRNVVEARVTFAWRDLRLGSGLERLDFVVMNPPFHQAGHENQDLGQMFIRRAAESLRKGGVLWLVANRHLPYEATTRGLFRTVTARREENGFKVIEAVK